MFNLNQGTDTANVAARNNAGHNDQELMSRSLTALGQHFAEAECTAAMVGQKLLENLQFGGSHERSFL